VASLLQFVASIAATPTVRLDLNDGATWKMLEGTEFPPPPLNQAIASTLLQDGAVIPSSKYGLRTLTLTLGLETSSADNTAAQLQALFRELDRPANLIRWQPHGVTNPVFFRTFRTSAESVLRHGQPDNRRKTLTVNIFAEYAGYGLLETPVSAVTVSTDPAAGSNGCFVDVTGVKGDVESPAIIRWPSSAIADDRTVVFATRRRGDPSAMPFPFQAEAMTQGTDTTAQVNDANFSGAGNNYSRCTFGTATMQNRLVLLDVGTASVDLRGTYRVFLRYRKNTSSDGINLQLRWGDANSWVNIDNDVYATVNNTTITTADLGLVSIPVGDDPVTDTDGTELVVSDSWRMVLRAERTSGSGTIDFDFLMLVPADDRLGIVQWNDDSSSPSDHWILRAEDWKASARDASGQVISAAPPAARAGGLPFLTPNQTNRIVMLRSVRAGDLWTLTTVSPVSVSYYPRYLTVRPAST
jgi:hypothetical protein